MANRFEKLAVWLRETLGIPEDIFLDVVDSLRRLRISGIISDFKIVKDQELLLEGMQYEAQWRKSDKTIYLTESLWNRLPKGDLEARFTIFHEIGHCVLNHPERYRKALGTKQFGSLLQGDEAEADEFARAFAAPSNIINNIFDLNAQNVAKIFGIPSIASTARVVDFKKSQPGYLTSLRKIQNNYLKEEEEFDSYHEARIIMGENAEKRIVKNP